MWAGVVRFASSSTAFLTVALLFSVTLLCGGCRTSATRQVSGLGPSIARLRAGASLQSEVDSLAEPLLASGEAYGMVVGVVLPDGTTQTFCYGRTGRPGDPNPPDADSLFQIGSVSKVFMAALLVRLVEEGQIRYDDTVRSILPTNVVVSPDVAGVTVYELATHTSGLPREPMWPSQLNSLVTYYLLGHNVYEHMTTSFLYHYLRVCPLRKQEPRQFYYSNIGFGLLANLIAVKTGRPTTDLILGKICRPLNMTNSVFFLDASQQRRLTVGHVGNQGCWRSRATPMAPWDMGDLMRPVAGMYSSANDLLLFAKANLGMLHQPLESTLAATHQVQIESDRGGEALGWIVSRFQNGRQIITFKDGMVSGYRAYIGMNLDARVAVVVLDNQFDWDDKIGHNLLLRLSGLYGLGQPGLQTRCESGAVP
ncbi:MAG TPA: serine hydrolase domain-containing protein [Verrucomicrobiae bacterium]|nr:serine hydrolase domain-containing protein [Verrucomicrobiae bacterium]